MKKIIIYQDTDLITLLDDDSSDIESYLKEVSKIFESSKVCMIETTSGNVLVRPSKINSIFVTELSDLTTKKTIKEKTIKADDKVSSQSDVIKD